jgi:hypothetical protein
MDRLSALGTVLGGNSKGNQRREAIGMARRVGRDGTRVSRGKAKRPRGLKTGGLGIEKKGIYLFFSMRHRDCAEKT